MTIAAIWTGAIVHRARERQTAVRLIQAQGGHVYYDFQEDPRGSGRYHSKATSHPPAWLLARLGDDFFSDVVLADLGAGAAREARDQNLDASLQNAMRQLPALHKLRSFSFGDAPAVDESLLYIGQLKHLEELFARKAGNVTDNGVSRLGGLMNLKALELIGANLTGAGLARLKLNRGMRRLDLSNNRELSDDALRVMAHFRDLEMLWLCNTKITSTGMEHLAGLTKLRVLDLSGNSGVTDEGVAYLSHLTSLEELDLHNTQVSSLAVVGLQRLKRLQRLDLSGNPDVDEATAPHLAQLVALRELDLHHTSVKLAQGNVGWLDRLAALEYLNLAETGSDCGAVVNAVPPTCWVAGSRTSSRNLSPRDLKEQEVGALRKEFALQYNYKLNALSAQADATIEVHDFIPSPEIFPPKLTLQRMIALTITAGVDPELEAVRPTLEALADLIGSQPSQADSAKEQARKLLDVARSNAALCKLYVAAIDLEFADRYDEYVEYFESLRSTSGLTDVEQREYQEASKYLRRCLYDAIQELGLPFDSSLDDHGDAIIRVWEDTRNR